MSMQFDERPKDSYPLKPCIDTFQFVVLVHLGGCVKISTKN